MKLFANILEMRCLIFALAAVFAVSCKDNFAVDADEEAPSYGKEVTLKFNVEDAAMPGSRAPGEEGDYDAKYLDDLWLLVFSKHPRDPKEEQPERYTMARKVNRIESAESGQPNATVTLPSELFLKDFTMVYLANSSRLWNKDGQVGSPDDVFIETPYQTSYLRGFTLEQCRTKVNLMLDDNEVSKTHKGVKDQFTDGLPMFGETQWKGNGEYPSRPLQLPKAVLLRAAARVDVGVKYPEGTDSYATDQAVGLKHFKLSNFYVVNSMDGMSVVPHSVSLTPSSDTHVSFTEGEANPWTVNKVSVPTEAKRLEGLANAVYAYPTGVTLTPQDAIEKQMYLPEQNVTKDVQAADRPFIIVEGYYGEQNIRFFSSTDEEEKKKAIPSYYRLDFVGGADKSYFDIKRSKLIRMNITSVSGLGYPTPEDAANNTAENITVNVSLYDIMNNNVQFDGQSYLSVERRNIDFPREANVSFGLMIDFGGDVKWDDIKVGYKDESGAAQYPDPQTGQIDLNGLYSAEKVEVPASKAGEKTLHKIKITTKKPFEAVDKGNHPLTLLINGKRLTQEISLQQKDISLGEWEFGNEEDLPLTGDSISTRSLFFDGSGIVQTITITPSKQDFTELKFYDNDKFTKDPVDWVHVEEKEENGVVSFTIEPTPNLTSSSRLAYGKLVYGTEADKTKTSIVRLEQRELVINEMTSVPYAMKWNSRNSGAANAEQASQTKAVKYKSKEEALLSCPYGWGLPDFSDFELLKKAGTETTEFASGIKMINIDGEMLMMYDSYNKTFLPKSQYWLNDGKIASISVSEGTASMKNHKLQPSEIEVSQSDPSLSDGYFVRCIRKFRLEKNEVKLEMTGKQIELPFITLNNTDEVENITYTGDNPLQVNVRKDASRKVFLISSQINWSPSQDVNIQFTLKMKDNGDNDKSSQNLNVTIGRRLPPSNANRYLRVGNLLWDFKNAFAELSQSEDWFLFYQNGTDRYQYNRPDFSKEWQDIPKNSFYSQGELKSRNKEYWGKGHRPGQPKLKYIEDKFGRCTMNENHNNRNNICRDLGEGWRLPTYAEWLELIQNYMYVYENSYKQVQTAAPAHNKKTHPIYFATDGKTITYFQLGPSMKDDEYTINNKFAYYTTLSEAAATNFYSIAFDRMLYDVATGNRKTLNVSNGLPEDGSLIFRRTWNHATYTLTRCVKVIE